MESREAQARSTLLNLNRKFHLDCVSRGIEIPGVMRDEKGWHRVSFHVAGCRSAWVQQAKIRALYPTLDTKVMDVKDKPCEWNAELWVKLKETADV